MPSSQLKRVERAIQSIRDNSEQSAGTADALQDLVDAIRSLEGRLSGLEAKAHVRPTAEMELPNSHHAQARQR